MNKSASHKLSSTLQKALLAVIVVTVLLGSMPVGKARAWKIGVQTGSRGSVILPQIYIGDLLMPSGLRQFTLYGNTGPLVGRSPAATGAQTVAAEYTVETWNGSAWVMSARTGMFTGTIGATQTAYRFPAPYIQPIASRGYFRVTWYFVWSSNGISLGSASVVSDRPEDHVCVTTYRLCQSYYGYFRTGGQGTGTW